MARHRRKLHSTKISTLIGRETVLMGDLSFTGGLHIEGRLVGNVNADPDSDSVLVLSERGQIEGEIRVPYVVLNGAVEGDVIVARHLELAAGANVQGNVYYSQMEMAVGAQINGNLVHEDVPQAPTEPVETSAPVVLEAGGETVPETESEEGPARGINVD